MTKTTNYQLPQWEAQDPVRRGDFNAAMEAIDAGLLENKAAVEGAQSTADTARTEAGAAQNTAQAAATAAATAQAAADTAQATADAAYSPSQKPYVAGTYTGTGAAITITLGFRPSFLIISGGEQTKAVSSSQGEYNLFTAGNVTSTIVTFTDTGFTLPLLADTARPAMVESGRKYDYIAFK